MFQTNRPRIVIVVDALILDALKRHLHSRFDVTAAARNFASPRLAHIPRLVLSQFG